MKINVVWSFEDTEFEEFQYEEARKAASLPNVVKIDLDEDEDEIEDYLYENYGFGIESWEYDD
jgi:hypothetical protein